MLIIISKEKWNTEIWTHCLPDFKQFGASEIWMLEFLEVCRLDHFIYVLLHTYSEVPKSEKKFENSTYNSLAQFVFMTFLGV